VALMPVAEALRRVLAHAAPLPTEMAELTEAHGRVLAADVAAQRTQPPADLSAMDGYAVRAADVAVVPARLKLIGEVAAGHPFGGTVGTGEAARIFTGGVMPPGADAVVIQENTTREGETVLVGTSTSAGRNVRHQGLDFSRGQILLTKGRRLSERDLALAAAMNHPALPVHRRPVVATLATGDELIMPGTTAGPGQIVYSNGFATMAMIRHEGARVVDLGIAPDRMAETVAKIRAARAANADILVTTGGASVGDHDLVRTALAAEGVDLSFWKIAMRPGRPMMHGRLGDMQVLGLPGNPVSAFVCSLLFMVPLIRCLAGRSDRESKVESAVLGCDLPENDERADYLRARLTPGPGLTWIATPFPIQDSSMLSPLADAGCLVIREPHAPAAKAGTGCVILKLAL
jgi:molybdopterin molybdotransferase